MTELDNAIRGNYPRKWKLEDAIRDQYYPPGTKFTLTAECRLDERGGIVVLTTCFHVVETGTVIDPAP